MLSFREIPNLNVFRPADAIETAECWAIALQSAATPSVLALSRQNLAAVRNDAAQNLCARGAYRIRHAAAKRQLVIVATGSEVQLALQVADAIEEAGIGADVVSMPCSELFDGQADDYRAELLPRDTLIVSLEAGVTLGWERYTGRDGLNIGLDRFGASAPAETLFEHFGFSAAQIMPKIEAKLGL